MAASLLIWCPTSDTRRSSYRKQMQISRE
jgi:hypothetical protein